MISNELQQAVDKVSAFWDSSYLAQPLTSLDGGVTANPWVGFGINFGPPTPRIVVFVRDGVADLGMSALEGQLRNLIGEPVPEVRRATRFHLATPKSFAAQPAGIAQAGESIQFQKGQESVVSGTLGAILVNHADPQEYWILSANHVMGQNGTGTVTTGALTLSNDVRVVPLVDTQDNPADVSVAKALSGFKISTVIPGFDPANRIQASAPSPPFTVGKFGAATGKTQGTAVILAKRIRVDDECCSLGINVFFKDQWLVEDPAPAHPFAAEGDSGSLVVAVDNQGGWFPFGLAFAIDLGEVDAMGNLVAGIDGQRIYAAVTPIKTVMDSLKGATGIDFDLATLDRTT